MTLLSHHLSLSQKTQMFGQSLSAVFCRRVLQGPRTNASMPFSRALKDAPTTILTVLHERGLSPPILDLPQREFEKCGPQQEAGETC